MKKFFVMAIAAAALVSCGVVKSPVAGVAYTDVKDGMAVTSSSGSSKVGTAEVIGYAMLYAAGDASIQTAAKEAGISVIHHVDYHSESLLGIINTYTIYVYGK